MSTPQLTRERIERYFDVWIHQQRGYPKNIKEIILIRGLAIQSLDQAWRPIETAPRNETIIWLGRFGEKHFDLGFWEGTEWAGTSEDGLPFDEPPTCWKPLPTPPDGGIEP